MIFDWSLTPRSSGPKSARCAALFAELEPLGKGGRRMQVGIVVKQEAIDSLSALLKKEQVDVSNKRDQQGTILFTCSKGHGRCTLSYTQPEHWVGDEARGDLFSVGMITDFWRFLKRAQDQAVVDAIQQALEPFVWTA